MVHSGLPPVVVVLERRLGMYPSGCMHVCWWSFMCVYVVVRLREGKGR